MMSLLVYLSIVMLASVRFCLTQHQQDYDSNLCFPPIQITVKSAFMFKNKLVMFFSLKNGSVIAIRGENFRNNVAIRNWAARPDSIKIWKEWNYDENGIMRDIINNFEDAYNWNDTHVIYFNGLLHTKATYNSNFTHILEVYSVPLKISKDELQIKVAKLLANKDYKYRTSLRFPEDTQITDDDKRVPKRALVYKYKSKNEEEEDDEDNMKLEGRISMFKTNISSGLEQWINDGESGPDIKLDGTNQIVSSFYVENYTYIDNNVKRFPFIEIESNGDYRIKRINVLKDDMKSRVVIEDLSTGEYAKGFKGNVRSFLNCPRVTILPSTSTLETESEEDFNSRPVTVIVRTKTPAITPSFRLPVNNSVTTPSPNYVTSSLSTHKTSDKILSTNRSIDAQSKNNKWIYFIVAIILLSIIAAVVLLIWFIRRKNNKEETLTDIKSKPIPENEDTSVDDTLDIYLDKDKSTKSEYSNATNDLESESPENETAVSQQVPQDNTKAQLNKKDAIKDETALYSLDGIQRYN